MMKNAAISGLLVLGLVWVCSDDGAPTPKREIAAPSAPVSHAPVKRLRAEPARTTPPALVVAEAASLSAPAEEFSEESEYRREVDHEADFDSIEEAEFEQVDYEQSV